MPEDVQSLLLITFLGATGTAIATGIGALPFFLVRTLPTRLNGTVVAISAGMMGAASLMLCIEGVKAATLFASLDLVLGIASGAIFFRLSERWLDGHENFDLAGLRRKGGLAALLIVAAMTVHSLPEGVAVGVAFGSSEQVDMTFGWAICIAIAIHNVPEGLAIALALRGQGIGPMRCVGWAIFTSLPQPLAAVPAAWLVWLFEPLLSAGMGFAAGAMFVLVVRHLVPDASKDAGPRLTSGGVVGGAVMMLVLMQATSLIAGTFN